MLPMQTDFWPNVIYLIVPYLESYDFKKFPFNVFELYFSKLIHCQHEVSLHFILPLDAFDFLSKIMSSCVLMIFQL